MNTCEEIREALLEFGWNEADRQRAREVLGHLQNCPLCAEAALTYDEVRGALAESGAEASDAQIEAMQQRMMVELGAADFSQRRRWRIGIRAVAASVVLGILGFGIGRWVAHFGTAVTVLVTVLLMALLFIHPHATATRPHVNPQAPFSLAIPALSLLSFNLFTKIAFNALSGLEQVAVFAGETRDPSRAVMRSAWIAAPLIAIIYILMTGSMLAYIPAAKIDLTGPIPQILAAAFAGGDLLAGRRIPAAPARD